MAFYYLDNLFLSFVTPNTAEANFIIEGSLIDRQKSFFQLIMSGKLFFLPVTKYFIQRILPGIVDTVPYEFIVSLLTKSGFYHL